MKPGQIAAYVFCLAAGLFLARFELHTDDTGVEVGMILALSFILGAWQPQHAWQWALLVGPWAPAAELWARMSGVARNDVSSAGGLALLTVVVVVLGLGGAYAGALLRRGLQAAAGV